MDRIQKSLILKDLEKKMVFLVGPRQAGKTWLSKEIAKNFEKSIYLNYDNPDDKEIILSRSWLTSSDLVIFDEIHKMSNWKNYLKGVYDTKSEKMRVLVTGSARLDTYDRVGDSLAGRYFRHRLMPFSMAEISQAGASFDLGHLMERGGFPEPLLAQTVVDADRWRSQYINSVLSTDIFDIEMIQNIKALTLIVNLLRYRVGSPISYRSIAEDVGVSSTTVKKYIQALEALFIIFTIVPYSNNIARSLLKEPKIYFYDSGMVAGDDGARLENTIAISLLKQAYALTDSNGQNYQVNYLRTKEGHEVDFILIKNDSVEKIIEVKLSDTHPSKSLHYFREKYNYPAEQIVKNVRNSSQKNDVTIYNAEAYLKDLFL